MAEQERAFKSAGMERFVHITKTGWWEGEGGCKVRTKKMTDC